MLKHHDLAQEFPEFKDAIHVLKSADSHFARLYKEYEEIDREIVRIEQEIEVSSDAYLESCKKKRLTLKDTLFEMLKSKAA